MPLSRSALVTNFINGSADHLQLVEAISPADRAVKGFSLNKLCAFIIMQIPLVIFPAPNYIDPVTRGPALLVVNIILWTIVTAVVALRIYTRICVIKTFGLDDILIILAMIMTTAFAIMSIYACQVLGFDRHIWDVPFSNAVPNLKYGLAVQMVFSIAVFFNRTSMLVLILRILVVGTGRLRYLIMILIAMSTIFVIIFQALEIFQCRPISLYWTLSFTPQNCINNSTLILSFGIVNLILDFITVVAAIPIVWRVKVNLRQRIIIALLFLAGGGVCIAGIIRISLSNIIANTFDSTWYFYPIFVASTAELYVGILGASIPATKPFFTRYLPRLLSAVRSDSTAEIDHSDTSQNKGQHLGGFQTNPYALTELPKSSLDRNSNGTGDPKTEDISV